MPIYPLDRSKNGLLTSKFPIRPRMKPLIVPPRYHAHSSNDNTAILYCEGNFGKIDGKTANGLVRYSETYRILSVVDSHKVGLDTGDVLDGQPNGIPIFRTLEEAFRGSKQMASYLIIGMAPADGKLSGHDRKVIFDAIALGMNIVNGLHEFLEDDYELATAALANDVTIFDIRKPKSSKDLRLFDGSIDAVTCPRIAILGTDCAIGKRTTATMLTHALNAFGLHAVMVATGQTGLLQGARHGVALDSVPSQFCCGELEGAIVGAFESDHPDIIIVEGQGALSHPAFCTSAFILRGSKPAGVILQHAPRRLHRCDFPTMPMPTPDSEIDLIESFSDTKVIGLTLNHEGMSSGEIEPAIEAYKTDLGIAVTDALSQPAENLVEIVHLAFPALFNRKLGQPTVSA